MRIAPETAVRRGSAVWPRRPGSEYLSEAIRLFFIARDSNGFWIAREANGALGGRFLLRHSAYRFAQTTSRPNGSATMLLNSRHDLDVPDQGSLRGLARLRGSNVLHSPDREARNATRSPGSRAREGRTSVATSEALFDSGSVFPARACRVRNAGTAHRDLVDCLSLIKYQEPITGDFHENARTSLV